MTTTLNLDIATIQSQNQEQKTGKYFTLDTTRAFYIELFSAETTVASVAAKTFFLALPLIGFVEMIFGLATAPFTFMNSWLDPERVSQIRTPPPIQVESAAEKWDDDVIQLEN